MQNWVQKTIKGVLICAICGSQVLQIGEFYTCINKFCAKRDDEPIRQQQTTHFWVETPVASGTASTISYPVDLFNLKEKI